MDRFRLRRPGIMLAGRSRPARNVGNHAPAHAGRTVAGDRVRVAQREHELSLPERRFLRAERDRLDLLRLHGQRRVIDRQDGQVAAGVGRDDPRLVTVVVAESNVNLTLARLGVPRDGRPTVHDVIVGQNESFIGAGNGGDDDSRAELVRNEVGRIGLIRIVASLGLDVEGIELADVGAGPDAGDADHRGLDPVNHVDEDSFQRRCGGQTLGVVRVNGRLSPEEAQSDRQRSQKGCGGTARGDRDESLHPVMVAVDRKTPKRRD